MLKIFCIPPGIWAAVSRIYSLWSFLTAIIHLIFNSFLLCSCQQPIISTANKSMQYYFLNMIDYTYHFTFHILYLQTEIFLNTAFVQSWRKDWILTFFFPPQGMKKNLEGCVYVCLREFGKIKKTNPKASFFMLWHGRKQCTADSAFTS